MASIQVKKQLISTLEACYGPFLMASLFLPQAACPIELTMKLEMFCICTVRYGSHQPHVPSEHLNFDQRKQGTQFQKLFNLKLILYWPLQPQTNSILNFALTSPCFAFFSLLQTQEQLFGVWNRFKELCKILQLPYALHLASPNDILDSHSSTLSKVGNLIWVYYY